jgi:hypothetical protein
MNATNGSTSGHAPSVRIVNETPRAWRSTPTAPAHSNDDRLGEHALTASTAVDEPTGACRSSTGTHRMQTEEDDS